MFVRSFNAGSMLGLGGCNGGVDLEYLSGGGHGAVIGYGQSTKKVGRRGNINLT